MGDQSILDGAAGMSEKVEQFVQTVYNQGNTISDRVIKADAYEASVTRRPLRVPIVRTAAMAGAKGGVNGQVLPRAHGIDTSAYFVGHIPFVYAYEITVESKEAGAKDNAIDLNKEIFGNSAAMASEWKDVFFHQPGDGIVAGRFGGSVQSTVVDGGVNKTVYTFNSASDMLKVNMLVEGMSVEVYSLDLDTRRAPAAGTALTYVEKIDWSRNSATLNQEIAGAADGDVLAIPGLRAPAAGFPTGYGRGASPALASFSSNYPANGTTNADGFQGDAFRHGYAYATNDDPTQFFYTLQKGSVPQLLPVVIPVGGPYNHAVFIQLTSQLVRKRRGVDTQSKLEGLVPLAQYEAIWRAGVQLFQTVYNADGGSYGGVKDGTPTDLKYEDTINIGPVTCHRDVRQPADRIEFLRPDNIGMVKGWDMQILKEGTQNGFILATDQATGLPTTMLRMYMHDSCDFYYREPGLNGALTGLTVPAGY